MSYLEGWQDKKLVVWVRQRRARLVEWISVGWRVAADVGAADELLLSQWPGLRAPSVEPVVAALDRKSVV